MDRIAIASYGFSAAADPKMEEPILIPWLDPGGYKVPKII